jgi:hypothetical protein
MIAWGLQCGSSSNTLGVVMCCPKSCARTPGQGLAEPCAHTKTCPPLPPNLCTGASLPTLQICAREPLSPLKSVYGSLPSLSNLCTGASLLSLQTSVRGPPSPSKSVYGSLPPLPNQVVGSGAN